MINCLMYSWQSNRAYHYASNVIGAGDVGFNLRHDPPRYLDKPHGPYLIQIAISGLSLAEAMYMWIG